MGGLAVGGVPIGGQGPGDGCMYVAARRSVTEENHTTPVPRYGGQKAPPAYRQDFGFQACEWKPASATPGVERQPPYCSSPAMRPIRMSTGAIFCSATPAHKRCQRTGRASGDSSPQSAIARSTYFAVVLCYPLNAYSTINMAGNTRVTRNGLEVFGGGCPFDC